MSTLDSITRIAGVLADSTRTEMLLALMDGRSYPASGLAAIARVSPSTASHHLSILLEAGLIEVVQAGRHRYHKIASPQVAEFLEGMGLMGGAPQPITNQNKHLVESRVCYNHLAGRLGVEVRIALEQKGVIKLDGDRYEVSEPGWTFLGELGVDRSLLRPSRRPLARACPDWTERVPHVGTWLGSELLQLFLKRHWLVRGEAPRSVRTTPVGRECLQKMFGIPG